MEAGKDPRTDQHKDRPGGGYPDAPPNSTPKPAPGGAGSGTESDPSKAPDAQPKR